MNLVFSAHARHDLVEIWLTIAENDPSVADRILAELEAKCSLLRRHPYLGRQRNELVPGLRSFPRRAFYSVPDTSTVEIVRVLDGRRDLPTLFRQEQ